MQLLLQYLSLELLHRHRTRIHLDQDLGLLSADIALLVRLYQLCANNHAVARGLLTDIDGFARGLILLEDFQSLQDNQAGDDGVGGRDGRNYVAGE